MKSTLLLSALALVAACAGTPDASPLEAGQPVSVTAAIPREGLPPQRLEPGQCGLFLWGMSAPRKFVFFSEGTAGDALILVNDEPTRLPMVAAGGDVFGQFLTEMAFADTTNGRTIHVKIVPGEALEGGQRIEAGSLTFRDNEGWETILPITGVRACMPG